MPDKEIILPLQTGKQKTDEVFNISLEEMISNGVNLFWMLTGKGAITFMNPKAKFYLKNEFDIDISNGMILYEVLPSEIGKRIRKFINHPGKNNEHQSSILLNNKFLQLSITSNPLNEFEHGFMVNIYCHTGLIKKIEKLKLKLKQNKFITDRLYDVVWIRDENFDLKFVSQSVFNQRGFTQEEFFNLQLEDLMPPESARYSKALISSLDFKQYTADNPLIYVVDYFKKDGSLMSGESTVFPIVEKDDIVSFYGITRDLTERNRNLRKINEQKSELITLLDNTDEMISSIDLDFKIVTMNDANRQRLRLSYGKTPEIGDYFLDFIQEENVGELKTIFNQIINGEKSSFQHIFTDSKGERPIYYETSIKPIKLENNEVLGLSIFVKDVTEVIEIQRTLQESESRLIRITNTTLEGIWEYNIVSNSLYLSHRLKHITGYTGANELGEFKAFIKDFIGKKDYEKFKAQLLNKITEGKPLSFELLVNSNNQDLWLQMKAFVSSNAKGVPVAVSGLLIDITQQKIQESALMIAKEKAEEMTRLKSSFIANMSHEVRTPLNGILGVSQLLEEMDLSPEVKRYLKLQKESGFRLLDTINNIMSLSRLEANPNKEDLKQFDLNEFILSQMGAFEIMANQKNIKFEFIRSKDQILVPLSEHLFYQVFNNLVGNAIKFTQKGGVKIITAIDNNYATFSVIDTGIGIKKANQAQIFDAFVQESSGTGREFEGSGLGLAIVKKYVEWAGGKITLQSKKGVGSNFTLNLPLSISNH